MDQGFHLSPNLGIALNVGVKLHKDTVVPGILLQSIESFCSRSGNFRDARCVPDRQRGSGVRRAENHSV